MKNIKKIKNMRVIQTTLRDTLASLIWVAAMGLGTTALERIYKNKNEN